MEQKRVMLIVTRKCNLNCVYCYEHHKGPEVMTFETARQILDEWLATAQPSIPYVIEVFGGEAFANFPLLKQIDEYINVQYSHLHILYETTTNGTLIHGDVQNWLRERKDRFLLSISLDGTREIHNLNRNYLNGQGSFEDIDIPFFIETWPGCTAKMTVSSKTLPYLAEGVQYLEKIGFRCDTTFSVGVNWDADINTPVLVRELEKLVNYYIVHPQKRLCTMLDIDLRLIFASADHDYRFCGAGVDMLCFDTNGDAYPCQGFSPISMGESSRIFQNFDENKFRLSKENPCRSCRWLQMCPNCYAANLQSMGDIQKVDPNLCKMYKLCILASAKIQFARILRNENLSHNDQLVLKAVSIIQDVFSHEA